VNWTFERFEAHLDERLDGALRGRARLTFAIHWLVCRACRVSLASYRRVVELTRTAFRDDEGPETPDSRSRRSL
jgi:hypothetical protein